MFFPINFGQGCIDNWLERLMYPPEARPIHENVTVTPTMIISVGLQTSWKNIWKNVKLCLKRNLWKHFMICWCNPECSHTDPGNNKEEYEDTEESRDKQEDDSAPGDDNVAGVDAGVDLADWGDHEVERHETEEDGHHQEPDWHERMPRTRFQVEDTDHHTWITIIINFIIVREYLTSYTVDQQQQSWHQQQSWVSNLWLLIFLIVCFHFQTVFHISSQISVVLMKLSGTKSERATELLILCQ